MRIARKLALMFLKLSLLLMIPLALLPPGPLLGSFVYACIPGFLGCRLVIRNTEKTLSTSCKTLCFIAMWSVGVVLLYIAALLFMGLLYTLK